MKLDCVLSACNLNENYINFIPLFIKAWSKLYPHVNIKIILISNKIPENLLKYEKHIILFEEIEGMYSSFISQYIRLLYPSLLPYDNGILITDIDMIPMNNTYYTETIKKIKDNKFITYRNRRLDKKNLVICYNCALNKTWSEIFKIKNKKDIINHLKETYKKIHYKDGRLKKGWYSDQLSLYKYVMKWNEKTNNHILLKDENTKWNRLCRKTNFTLSNDIVSNIKNKIYTDYHAYCPYNEHKKINDTIVKILEQY